MTDILCVGAIYFGVFCAVAAVMCAAAAILERFPRATDKLIYLCFPQLKRDRERERKARYRVACSPRCRYYGTLKVGDGDRMDFCYKYETEAGKLPRRFASERKPEHEQLQR